MNESEKVEPQLSDPRQTPKGTSLAVWPPCHHSPLMNLTGQGLLLNHRPWRQKSIEGNGFIKNWSWKECFKSPHWCIKEQSLSMAKGGEGVHTWGRVSHSMDCAFFPLPGNPSTMKLLPCMVNSNPRKGFSWALRASGRKKAEGRDPSFMWISVAETLLSLIELLEKMKPRQEWPGGACSADCVSVILISWCQHSKDSRTTATMELWNHRNLTFFLYKWEKLRQNNSSNWFEIKLNSYESA